MTFAFGWMIGQPTGWGQYGRGLHDALTRLGYPTLLPHGAVDHDAQPLAEHDGMTGWYLEPIGNDCHAKPDVADGWKVAGLLVMEEGGLPQGKADQLATYDALLVGCPWSLEVCKRAGLTHAHLFPQGVDTRAYPERTAPRTPDGRFRVFSGGKLEVRKSQDIVIDTFRRLLKAVPHATLVPAWHNYWPKTVGRLDHAGLVRSLPPYDDATERWDFQRWLEFEGIPTDNIEAVGPLTQADTQSLLATCDAGIFVSRAEGNGNMALAECLSAGLPCITSPHSGHAIYPASTIVRKALRVRPTKLQPSTIDNITGWYDTDPQELALMLAELALTPYRVAPQDVAAFRWQWDWDARAEVMVGLLSEESCPHGQQSIEVCRESEQEGTEGRNTEQAHRLGKGSAGVRLSWAGRCGRFDAVGAVEPGRVLSGVGEAPAEERGCNLWREAADGGAAPGTAGRVAWPRWGLMRWRGTTR